jgi:hypothetical protein
MFNFHTAPKTSTTKSKSRKGAAAYVAAAAATVASLPPVSLFAAETNYNNFNPYSQASFDTYGNMLVAAEASAMASYAEAIQMPAFLSQPPSLLPPPPPKGPSAASEPAKPHPVANFLTEVLQSGRNFVPSDFDFSTLTLPNSHKATKKKTMATSVAAASTAFAPNSNL